MDATGTRSRESVGEAKQKDRTATKQSVANKQINKQENTHVNEVC